MPGSWRARWRTSLPAKNSLARAHTRSGGWPARAAERRDGEPLPDSWRRDAVGELRSENQRGASSN
jgi:hypothetical protein